MEGGNPNGGGFATSALAAASPNGDVAERAAFGPVPSAAFAEVPRLS